MNRCYMCSNSSESISHLFLHYTIASDLWNMFHSIFRLIWIMPFKKMPMKAGAQRIDRTIQKIWMIWTKKTKLL